jgi:hypothetical protein
MVDATYPVGGIVGQEKGQVGSTNADWTKSQEGGNKGPVRSKYVAQMKKKMKRG